MTKVFGRGELSSFHLKEFGLEWGGRVCVFVGRRDARLRRVWRSMWGGEFEDRRQ
jgi:hypothetical protein